MDYAASLALSLVSSNQNAVKCVGTAGTLWKCPANQTSVQMLLSVRVRS